MKRSNHGNEIKFSGNFKELAEGISLVLLGIATEKRRRQQESSRAQNGAVSCVAMCKRVS